MKLSVLRGFVGVCLLMSMYVFQACISGDSVTFTLETSPASLIRELANDPDDTLVNNALASTVEAKKKSPDESFLTLFYQEIVKLDPNVSLYQKFGNGWLRDNLRSGCSNDEVIRQIERELFEACERTGQIIERRIGDYEYCEWSVEKQGKGDYIIVKVRGFKDIDNLRERIQCPGRLEFWQVYESKDIKPIIDKMDEFSKADSSAGLYGLLSPMASQEPVVGVAKLSDTAAVNKILKEAAKNGFYDSKHEVKFLWANKPAREGIISLYAIEVTTRDGAPLLDGSCISNAMQDMGSQGAEVNMTMNSSGAREWKRITGENVGRCLAIVLDNQVYSAPRVMGEIAGGRSQITGNFTVEEAKLLAFIIKSGTLPLPVRIVNEVYNKEQ